MQAGRLPVPLAQVNESRPLVYGFLGQLVQFLPVYYRSCTSLISMFSTLTFLSYSSVCWHGWLLLVQPIPPGHRWPINKLVARFTMLIWYPSSQWISRRIWVWASSSPPWSLSHLLHYRQLASPLCWCPGRQRSSSWCSAIGRCKTKPGTSGDFQGIL